MEQNEIIPYITRGGTTIGERNDLLYDCNRK